MDKYAPFVWASYSIALSLLGLVSLFVVVRLAKAKSRHARLKAEETQ
ncbi:hypothetical protein Hbal_0096 [Hirschia baltica ATCC 49814]|uniref:Heme exporter protein D n=1 Tax=Hirschia baltica (strain ATCC 49814 / DSM 5838 / IFAM 1418) TaxID=582402 RepID=C6XKW9_HIRBI|nr:hypothetical protein Hbal_0096 [Hirschia baltica ATCC 49814]